MTSGGALQDLNVAQNASRKRKNSSPADKAGPAQKRAATVVTTAAPTLQARGGLQGLESAQIT